MVNFRPLAGLTLAVLPALGLLIGLGTWQLQRLDWKLALIEQIEARAIAPVQPIDEIAVGAAEPADMNFWHVEATGRFDHDDEIHLYTRDEEGRAGYRVITPLIRDGKLDLLVDRGFVPEANKATLSRSQGQTPGVITVRGVARIYDPPNAFMPDNQPTDNIWFSVDIEQMSAQAGLSDVLPVVLQADATPNPGGLPQGGQGPLALTNNHLGYAVTWYGLALALFGVYLAYHKMRGRLTFGVAGPSRDG